jgi:hypothetical protein
VTTDTTHDSADAIAQTLVNSLPVLQAARSSTVADGVDLVLDLDPGLVKARADQQGLPDASVPAAANDPRLREMIRRSIAELNERHTSSRGLVPHQRRASQPAAIVAAIPNDPRVVGVIAARATIRSLSESRVELLVRPVYTEDSWQLLQGVSTVRASPAGGLLSIWRRPVRGRHQIESGGSAGWDRPHPPRRSPRRRSDCRESRRRQEASIWLP